MKGRKTCPKCNKSVGLRTKDCGCGHNFYVNIKQANTKIGKRINWRELSPGQTIRIVSSERAGKFQVKKIVDDGIEAYGKSGYEYIYMGEPRVSKSGLLLNPSKIRLIDER